MRRGLREGVRRLLSNYPRLISKIQLLSNYPQLISKIRFLNNNPLFNNFGGLDHLEATRGCLELEAIFKSEGYQNLQN